MPPDERTPRPASNPEFALLAGDDDYGRYFALLTRTFERILEGYRIGGSGDTFEAQAVKVYLRRLIGSVEALRRKYSYTPATRRMLWVDLEDSGFPNGQEMSLLGVDLLHRDNRLRELPGEATLTQLMLDAMFDKLEEPEDLLWQLSERSYLEQLHEDRLFLPFVSDLEHHGPLRQEAGRKGARTYVTAWGCYDFRSNRPFVHILTFEQDGDQAPLEEMGPNHLRLLGVIETEGARVPDVGILAMAIDDGLETIHPKVLKRIGFGPLYTPLLLRRHPDPGENERALLELFERHGDDDDVILTITDEIVFSKRQQVTKPLFSPSGRVREIFHIPESDPESYRRRASVVHKHVLLPHALAQQIGNDLGERVPEFRGARLLTYDAKGAIHGF